MNRSEGQWVQPELSVPVHRGLAEPFDASKGTGLHWTGTPQIAKNLANMQRDTPEKALYSPRHTDIIHGEMPISTIETNKDTLRALDVLGVDDPREAVEEREITATKGKPITVTGITRIKETPQRDKATGKDLPYKVRARKRTYNPPREMKA